MSVPANYVPLETPLYPTPASGGSNPNYDPNNPFCQLIGRQSSNGGRAYTTALYSNLGNLNTSGLDWTFNWRAALQDMFGHNLPVEVAAAHAGTLCYELLTGLGARTPREYRGAR